MFERFTPEARQVVRLAQVEARQLRHPFIGTEHLLIGMVAGEGAAGQVLAAHGLTSADLRRRLLTLTDDDIDTDALSTLGIDLERVKEAAEANLGPGALDRKPRPPVKPGHLPVSRHAKKALELALREAVYLKSGEIGSGHLLLGVLRGGDELANRLLREARVDLVSLRSEVTRLIEARAA